MISPTRPPAWRRQDLFQHRMFIGDMGGMVPECLAGVCHGGRAPGEGSGQRPAYLTRLTAVGRIEWKEELRAMASPPKMIRRFYELLGRVMATRTCEEWWQAFAELDVPAARVFLRRVDLRRGRGRADREPTCARDSEPVDDRCVAPRILDEGWRRDAGNERTRGAADRSATPRQDLVELRGLEPGPQDCQPCALPTELQPHREP